MNKSVAFFAWAVPVIFTAIFGFPALSTYFKTKKVEYSIESVSPILNYTDSKHKVYLKLDSVELENPYSSIIRIKNIGGEAIKKEDFQSDIQIDLEGDAKIISAALIASEPEGLEATIQVEKKNIKLKPLLINPDDHLTFSIITDKNRPEFNVHGRIAELRSITKASKDKPTNVASIFSAIYVCLNALALTILVLSEKGESAVKVNPKAGLAYLIFGYVVNIAYYFYGLSVPMYTWFPYLVVINLPILALIIREVYRYVDGKMMLGPFH
jgi:hypothetical protein